MGAGHGGDVLAAVRAGFDVTAIEPGADLRQVCYRRSGVMPIDAFFESVDLSAAGYDFVVVNQVLEHVFDVNEWIERLSLLLCNGGLLCVSVPNFGSVFRYLLRERDPFLTPPHHLNYFAASTLSLLLSRHGLKPVHHFLRTKIEAATVARRVSKLMRPVARSIEPLFSRLADSLGFGVTLTLYAEKSL